MFCLQGLRQLLFVANITIDFHKEVIFQLLNHFLSYVLNHCLHEDKEGHFDELVSKHFFFWII